MPKARAGLRIVSLAPSATSILWAIGAKRFLVGVTKWCGQVAPVAGLPQLGDCWHMESVDEVLRLDPGLVIGSVPYKPETVAKLLEYPLNFLAMNPRTLADVYRDIGLLGQITARTKAAEALVHKMQRGLAVIEKRSKKKKHPLRFYCEAWPHPRISSPPWVAELVGIAGGVMVVPAGEMVSETQVAAANPDVVVIAWTATGETAEGQKAYEVAEWKDTPAIREKRVYVVRDEWLNTPGPPLLDGVRALEKIVESTAKRRQQS